jgi:cardiolipin synthase
MNIPNLITILRILLVPLAVWLIIGSRYDLAFIAFVSAGIGDGVDGYLARKWKLQTELGAYLDPVADKALLVSIYVTLGFLRLMPDWLVIMVVTRDVLIVGAVIISWLLDKPVRVAPLMTSKVNTAGQILLAGLTLGLLAIDMQLPWLMNAGLYGVVAALTFASGALYMREWLRHMANGQISASQ